MLVLIGYFCARRSFPGGGFWPGAERLTYFVLFPALLIDKLAVADLSHYNILPLVIAIAATLAAGTALLYALRPWMRIGGPAFSSIYQGSIRFNSYVALAASAALWHQQGAILAALMIGLLIPPINVLSVLVLSREAGHTPMPVRAILWALARNPLILSCLAGIALNLSGLRLVYGSATVVQILARATLPVGLLAVGAGLRLDVAQSRPGELTIAATVKLIVLPAIALAASHIVGLRPLETAILVLFAAMPCAPSSYILARQLGGDGQLMAALITAETALAMLTLPLVLSLVM